MASSLTSYVPKSFKYDVFLSFRGEDTRKNFIAHLYHALREKNIHTYKDDKKIKKGKGINDELVKIMEFHKQTGHTAYPVFYDVEPTEVRNQTGAVGEAFARHGKKEAAGKWRKALKEAADLAGWELKNTADGDEAKFIHKIVEELSLELRSINFFIDEKLVGMETRINNILSSLGTASDDVHMIGIWGIGGGGKTTLAGAIFNAISFRFKGKSFIDNVKDGAKASGLKSLQKRVLSDVLNDQGINIDSINEGKNKMSWMMQGIKVLLVLDDVDHIDQLQALAGNPNWFMPGSMIIITTREQQVLVAHGVKYHNVSLLTDEEAICLFTRYAFGREIPKGYEEQSRQVVCYTAGLPLTLKVLGSCLCGKSESEWKDALDRLKKIPEKEIQEIFLDVATILKGWPKHLAIEALKSCGFYAVHGLRVLEQKALITISRDGHVGMHDQLQDMGRNINCRTHPDMPHRHSRLWNSTEIEDILATCQGTEASRCIKFKYEGQNPEIIMQGLGKMKELQVLHVNMVASNPFNQEIDKLIPYFPDALRYLSLKGYPFRSLPKEFQANNLVGIQMESGNMVQLWEEGERKVLNKLRFLRLNGLKLRFLDLGLTPNLETLEISGRGGNWVEVYMPVACPKLRSLNFVHVNLRGLDIGRTPNLEELHIMDYSDVQELHMGYGCVKLRKLVLSGSMVTTFNLRPSPNLETLNLYGCMALEEIHIAECPTLTEFNIGVSNLSTLDLRLAPNLNSLSLVHCVGLVELQLPTKCLNLMSVRITKPNLRTLDLGLTPNLKRLVLGNCCYLEKLHMASECQKLVHLDISHSKLETIDLGLTPNVEKLKLEGCSNLVELHAPIGCFKNLVYLDLSDCLKFTSFLFRLIDNTSGIMINESLEDRPLAELSFTLKRCPIHPETNFPKFQSTYLHKEDLPSLRRSIEKLICEGPCACTKLEIFEKGHVLAPQVSPTLVEDQPDQPTTAEPSKASKPKSWKDYWRRNKK